MAGRSGVGAKLGRAGKALGDTARATVTSLRAPDRSTRVREGLSHWSFVAERRLPSAYLVELLPEVADVRSNVGVGISHHYELPYGERTLIDVLVRTLRPSLVFEFGTYTGTTTLVLADAAPEGTEVHTVDLPPRPGTEAIGRAIREAREADPASVASIVEHRCGLRDLDPAPWRGRVDLVFVDASHQEEQVRLDSHLALDLLAPGGVVVWDDYQAAQPGVVAALNRLADEGLALHHISASRLAIHLDPRGRAAS